MSEDWDPSAPGVLRLPSGRLLRGRALRRPVPPGPTPDFALHLLAARPDPAPWLVRWVRWPDFRLPHDRGDAADALSEAWSRAGDERVEVACDGGRGRTGTALACIAVIDGVPADQAVPFVREHYDARAVETPWQRPYVVRYPRASPAR
ncbi:MAG: protein-tyrosine phosphatase family protein [Acidimicrobiales bacterium]